MAEYDLDGWKAKDLVNTSGLSMLQLMARACDNRFFRGAPRPLHHGRHRPVDGLPARARTR